MRVYSVGICDLEPRYVVSVMEFINSIGKRDSDLRAVAFTSMEAVDDYLKNHELDIILTNDISSCETEERSYSYKGVECLYLAENKDDNINCIFKYQKMQSIYEALHNRLKPKAAVRDNVIKKVAVYSPIGRSGKTILSKALANEDEVRGGLYVGFEEYSGEPILANEIDALYHIKQKLPDTLDIVINASVLDGTVRMFQASGAYFDIRDISREDVEWFNNELLLSGRFSTIVYDIGGGTLSDYDILNCFDEIYMPILRDEISVRKIQRFEKIMKDMGHRNILNKMVRVEVPNVDYKSSEITKVLWELRRQ